MFDLVVVMAVERPVWLAVGRKRVCIGRAMDLSALAAGAVAEGMLTVFVVCYCEAYRAVVQADFRMTTVLAELEVVLRSMTAEACSAYSAGSWAGNRVARWHAVCCHSLLRLARLVQRRRQLEVVSSPDVQSALGRLALQDCMPLARADVTAAVAAVLVAEKRLLLQAGSSLAGLGMNAAKLYSLLEEGSVSRWLSSLAVGPQGSWSHDAQASLLWKVRVHCACPAFPVA